MVEIDVVYEGRLRCRLTHGPSGQTFSTDAPTDHYGTGSAFSPTDLVAAALGSCMLTTMGIVAMRHQIDLIGTTAHVVKEMADRPMRRIGKLVVAVSFAKAYAQPQRELLERTAAACPVHQGLSPETVVEVRFVYPDAEPA